LSIAAPHEREEKLPPTMRELLLRMGRRAMLVAVVGSLIIHAVFLVVSMLIMISRGGSGVGEGPGEVQVAVVTEAELKELQEQAVGVVTPTVPEAELQDPTLEAIMDTSPGDDAARSSEELSDLGPMAGGGDISMESGDGLGGAGGGGASFFGVEAQGNRFAYLFDVSGSMNDSTGGERAEPRIATLRAELGESIEKLTESSQFLLVKFSSDAQVIGGSTAWVEASTSGKRAAMVQIALLNPEGGTNPLPGFQIIFGMRPKPDAIYFMTDGEFPAVAAEEVALLNKKYKVPIHCICLGSRAGEDVMRRIAKQSRGTFTYVGGP
jgi:hypothetical protein